jgi:peptide/nickel transport system ATP-binding protein
MKSDLNRVKGETLLEMKGLKIEGYSGDAWHPIVKGIDLSLKRGEVLGLIGESGAGKSTLGLAGMGFARPGCRISGGTISFDGIDRIAYVAQSAAAGFNPAHRIIEQTVETAINHGVMERDRAEDDARDLYGRLQLPNPDTIGARYPHQVSGGQLQRAMTAMAMSCRPDLIIFDEPTTALDVTTQVEVLAAMRNIVESSIRLQFTLRMIWRWWHKWRTGSWCCGMAIWLKKRRHAQC